jgi:NADH:ubiquinone oxidoreductase subunit E
VGTFCSIGGSTKLQNHFQNHTKKKQKEKKKEGKQMFLSKLRTGQHCFELAVKV